LDYFGVLAARWPGKMTLQEQILKAIDSPREVEVLYRQDPKGFAKVFPGVFLRHPDSMILKVWYERLSYQSLRDEEKYPPAATWMGRDILLTVVLSLIAGTLVKLPHFFPVIDDGQFYSRNVGVIVFTALIAYFCIQKTCRMKVVLTIATLVIASFVYLNILPYNPQSQTIILSCMHMPFFLWSLLGVAFLEERWQGVSGRMDYIRYNGELLIHTTIILIGGMVLTGVTFALFQLIDAHVEDWYVKNVVVYGSVASPIVATLLMDKILKKHLNIAPPLAKIFTPLFLLTVIAYLLAMAVKQKSPYTDRDFLIAFNGLLLIVLGLCVFSISERDPQKTSGFGDLMNVGLVVVTLTIDHGFTPNRVAVLGANLLVCCHLSGIIYHYVRIIRRRHPFAPLEGWIMGYIPVYTTWSIIVAFGFPLVFGFK